MKLLIFSEFSTYEAESFFLQDSLASQSVYSLLRFAKFSWMTVVLEASF